MTQEDSIEFLRDRYGAITGRTETGHFNELGSWLVTDIQEYSPDCLLVLARLEDVRSGRSALEEWNGNAYSVKVTPGGVEVDCVHTDDPATSYSYEDAHSVALKYWEFIAPEVDDKNRALAVWENENARQHPCRPHL
jgi:uncharacterized protein YacL (UPF0231 family)